MKTTTQPPKPLTVTEQVASKPKIKPPKPLTVTEQVYVFIANVQNMRKESVAQFNITHPGAEKVEKKTPDLMFLAEKPVKMKNYGLFPEHFVMRVKARGFCNDVNKTANLTFALKSKINLILKEVKCPEKIEVLQLTMMNEIAPAAKSEVNCTMKKKAMVISREGPAECSFVPTFKKGTQEDIILSKTPHPDVYMKLFYSVKDLNQKPKGGSASKLMGEVSGKAGKGRKFILKTTTTTTTTSTKKPKKKAKNIASVSLFAMFERHELPIPFLLAALLLMGLWMFVARAPRRVS